MSGYAGSARSERVRAHSWSAALLFAAPGAGLILGLVFYWFAVANRSVVFLYDHDMGPRVPDTSPFSPVTSSRYWMTGFVAGGMVMALTIAVNWLLGRLSRRYEAPAWWRVWLLAAPVLLVGIPAITMRCNAPTLPLGLALFTTLVALGGLALALQPASWAARRPLELALLALDGGCLALWMTTLPGLAYLPYWLTAQRWVWVWIGLASLGVGVVGLALNTGARLMLRHRLPARAPGLRALLVAAACCAYLGLPLVHYLFVTDGYFYITDMDNFFSRVWWVQALAWALPTALAWGVVAVRGRWLARLARRRPPHRR
jgi:hypothetical protein